MFISIFLSFKQKPRPINPLNSWTSNLSVLNHARSSVSMLSVTEDLCHQVLGNITLADWVLNRGTLPVTSSGYLNSKKVTFRTLRTMRKQFPVVPMTTHRCVDGKMPANVIWKHGVAKKTEEWWQWYPRIAIPIPSETKEAVQRLLSEKKKKAERVEIWGDSNLRGAEKAHRQDRRDPTLRGRNYQWSSKQRSIVCFSIQREEFQRHNWQLSACSLPVYSFWPL